MRSKRMNDNTSEIIEKSYADEDNTYTLQKSERENVKIRYECPHYMRKCQFYTPCCKNIYRCRFCHDSAQDHLLHRDDVTEIVCSDCGAIQPFQQNCEVCGLQFGKYFCLECKLFDDEENKEQFHCKGCSICRIGKKENYFHCEGCDMCLPINLRGKHRCIENLSRANCPVCLEDIHTSREPSQIPPCHHLIHKSCFTELTMSYNKLACPVCNKSLYSEEALKPLWQFYDTEIKSMPMTTMYQGLLVETLCQDCQNTTLAPFHVIGLKCQCCGGYNTVRNKGPYYKRVKSKLIEVEISNSGLVSMIRENDYQSNSEESYDHSRISNTRSPSPVVPFWLYESEADADLSSTSIVAGAQDYAADEYLRSEEYATSFESDETSFDQSVLDQILLSSTSNNEDP